MHHAHDLMARNEREPSRRKLPLDHVEIGAAAGAGPNPDAHLLGAGFRQRVLDRGERGRRDRRLSAKEHREHQRRAAVSACATPATPGSAGLAGVARLRLARFIVERYRDPRGWSIGATS
jgi:hypothetical protein